MISEYNTLSLVVLPWIVFVYLKLKVEYVDILEGNIQRHDFARKGMSLHRTLHTEHDIALIIRHNSIFQDKGGNSAF